MDSYRDYYSPYRGEPEEMMVSAAVAPDTAEQVQQIVKIANRYKVPLWMISCGKNHMYGLAAPVLSDSVVLDLNRNFRFGPLARVHHTLLLPSTRRNLSLE